jgi:hypothetical protein
MLRVAIWSHRVHLTPTHALLFHVVVEEEESVSSNCKPFDIVISVVTFVGSLILTITTIARCKNNWQYILLAIENLALSIALSSISLSASLGIHDDTHTIISYVMCMFAFTGAAVGGVGYISLVVQNWSNKNVRTAFGSIFGGNFVLVFVAVAIIIRTGKRPNFLAILVFFHLAAVSMTDWVLGAIANDISGIPHGRVEVLIWMYFAIRRLPLLIS